MTLNTTHVRGKGVLVGGWPWNLAGVFVVSTCMCVPSFMYLWLVVVEKIPTEGGFDLVPLDISSKFHLKFRSLGLVSKQHVLSSRPSLLADDWRQHRECLKLFQYVKYCKWSCRIKICWLFWPLLLIIKDQYMDRLKQDIIVCFMYFGQFEPIPY